MTEFAGLPLTIKKNPRAKRVLVKMVPRKGLEVVVPKGFDTAEVPDILEAKRTWIDRTRLRMEAGGTDLTGRTPDLPDAISFRATGRGYDIGYVDRPGRITLTPNASRLIVRGTLADRAGVLDALSRFTAKQAREHLVPRLDAMARALAFSYSAIRIRRQKTRWGSCSARGTISLNAKLLFLPPELVEHLLLHELCHTRHLNHSPAYWKLVARHQPDFARLEEALRTAGRYVPDWFA